MIGVLMKSENLDTDRQTVGEGHVRMKVQTKQCVYNPKSSKVGNLPPEALRFSSTNSEGSSLAVSFWIFLWLKPLRLWQSITVSTGDFYMNYLLVG